MYVLLKLRLQMYHKNLQPQLLYRSSNKNYRCSSKNYGYNEFQRTPHSDSTSCVYMYCTQCTVVQEGITRTFSPFPRQPMGKFVHPWPRQPTNSCVSWLKGGRTTIMDFLHMFCFHKKMYLFPLHFVKYFLLCMFSSFSSPILLVLILKLAYELHRLIFYVLGFMGRIYTL